MLLEAAEHYDRFISLAEAAWISGAIDRRERSDIMRHWEGRLLNTADRCARIIGRALEGSESDANSLLPKRKFRNPEDQRRNCRMNRDRQPDRQPDPKETLPAGNQPTGSLESQGYVGLRIPPGFLSGFCRCGVRIDPTSKKNSANAWHNSPESFLESGIRFDRY